MPTQAIANDTEITWPQLKWLGTVTSLTHMYLQDTRQAYSNLNKIGDWHRDSKGWQEMKYDNYTQMLWVGPAATVDLQRELDAARAFRIRRMEPTPRHPLDFSPHMESR